MNKYDVIIIGGGPAGLTAAIYAGRRALKTLVLTMDIGGQMNLTQHIENHPGFEVITGSELGQKMMAQAKKLGAEVSIQQQVISLEKKEDNFLVKTNSGEFETQSVILAFGKTPRKMELESADKYLGKGLSYCATCDGPLFKNKKVAVVGGGNSALDAVIFLSEICEKVYLIHRRDAFRGEEVLVEKIKQKGNIEFILNSVVSEIIGAEFVEGIKTKDVVSGEEKETLLDGIFVEIGYEVAAEFVKNIVNLDEKNQLVVDCDCKTSAPGIFAAGDLTQIPYKQIVISEGQGAVAALSAYDYIQKKQGKPTVKVDWGTK